MLKTIASLISVTVLTAGCFGGPDFDGFYRINPQASYAAPSMVELESSSPKNARKHRELIAKMAFNGMDVQITDNKVMFISTGKECSLVDGNKLNCDGDDDRGYGKLRLEDEQLVITFVEKKRDEMEFVTEIFFDKVEK